jgi:hypothetical protein
MRHILNYTANLSHALKLFRFVISYTRFEVTYTRLYPFENVFLYHYQIDIHIT